MIEFKNFPPKEPGDVVLTPIGLSTLKNAARTRAVAPSDQATFRMTGVEDVKQVSERMYIIGSTVGSVIAEAIEGPISADALEISADVARQYSEAASHGGIGYYASFANGILSAMTEYNVLVDTVKEGVTA